MRIKIIELLNKIYNHEDMPRKIIFDNHNWLYNDKYQDYFDEEHNSLIGFLIDDITYETREFLNTEVEIKEEDKKIEKLKIKDGKITGNLENGNYYCYTLSSPQAVIVNKLNELIDDINKLKENK